MTQSPPPETQEEKQRLFFERARKGVLKFLQDKGGKLSMAELHDYSASKFFVQHQGFSRMMETFVEAGLVDHDWATHQTTLTEAGKNFIAA